MKHKLFFLAVLLLTAMILPQSAWAYNFSSVAPSGQTLYYNVQYYDYEGFYYATVVHPYGNVSNPWYGYSKPTGALTIPSTINYYGSTCYVIGIEEYAFYSCTDLTQVDFESGFGEVNGVYYGFINSHAFAGCSNIEELRVSNSVQTIQSNAFLNVQTVFYAGSASGAPWGAILLNPSPYEEDGLYYTDSTKVTLVGAADSLTEIIIPNTVIHIADNAFYNRFSLISVSLGNSVKIIGAGAFGNCTGITSITIGRTVQKIGAGAFTGCRISTMRFLADSCINLGATAFCDTNLTTLNIGDNVKMIPDFAFSGCTNLSVVTIPSSTTAIGKYAFRNTGAIRMTLGPEITDIGEGAFQSCPFTSITLPQTVKTIGNSAFSGCRQLRSIHIPDSVRIISPNTFSGCISLTTMTIGDSVRLIGFGAFRDCVGLSSVTIGKSVNMIDEYAFANCINLNTVNFNAENCMSMGTSDRHVFEGCSAFATLNFGVNVKNIPNFAFSECAGLVSVNIPDSVLYVGRQSFYKCTNISSVSFGDAVSHIGKESFYNCYRLMSVHLGESVNIIDTSAFYNCAIIGELVIPQRVTTIKKDAFNSCYGITEITCLGRVAPVLDYDNRYTQNQDSLIEICGPFNGVDTNIVVNVPCGSANLYTGRWKEFHNFNEMPFYFNALSENTSKGTVEIEERPSCDDPEAIIKAKAKEGYHFDHWSDGSTENPYHYTATGSVTLIAYFAVDVVGIEEYEVQGITILSFDGRIVIEGAANQTVNIYSVEGRLLYSDNNGRGMYDVPSSGVYILRVGDLPARKVVVIR